MAGIVSTLITNPKLVTIVSIPVTLTSKILMLLLLLVVKVPLANLFVHYSWYGVFMATPDF